jgi:hypothetical protein
MNTKFAQLDVVTTETWLKLTVQGNAQPGFLTSPGMSEVQTPDPKNTQHKLTLYNNVRIEWAEGAAAHALEVLKLFVKEEKKEEIAG